MDIPTNAVGVAKCDPLGFGGLHFRDTHKCEGVTELVPPYVQEVWGRLWAKCPPLQWVGVLPECSAGAIATIVAHGVRIRYPI